MIVDAYFTARQRGLGHYERAVLLALANFHNDNTKQPGRQCHPSVRSIAREAGISVRRVQYALRELERVDLVRTHHAEGVPAYYVLMVPRWRAPEKRGPTGVHDVHGGGAQRAGGVRTTCTQTLKS